MKTQKLDVEVLAVFSRLAVDGNSVRILDQLERPLYQKVNEALEALGGKWNRKRKGHVFETLDPKDMADKIDNAIVTGEVVCGKKLYDFFETPRDVALRLIQIADIRDDSLVLEPSAGRGAIAECIREFHPKTRINVIEIQELHRKTLNDRGFEVIGDDFLATGQVVPLHDRIVMNPPFSGQKDIDHVMHAFETFLRPGGVLVSVMSQGVSFRGNNKSVNFRKFVGFNSGSICDLPAGSFKESGTGVNTVLVRMRKEK